MKYLLILFTAITAHMTHAQNRLAIGMTMEECTRIYPGLESNVHEKSTQVKRPETLHGLEGHWTYNFEDTRLKWMQWSRYNDQVSDSNFAQCLSAARHLIDDYTLEYGKPNVFVTGDTTFALKATGYDVIQARWNDAKGMKINIYFKFLGGKTPYTFLVAVKQFDKSYPYWE